MKQKHCISSAAGFVMGMIGCIAIHSTAFGATLTVGPTGDHQTIQAAIDAAAADDVIVISAGTYVEDLNIGDINTPGNKKNNLTLRAADGAAVEIHSANDKTRTGSLVPLGADFGPADRLGFYIYGENITVEGIKFVQPSTEVNALGISIIATITSSNVTFENCEFEGPGGDSAGDIVGVAVTPMDVVAFTQGASLAIANVVFENCIFHDIPYAFATANLPLDLGVPAPSPEASVLNSVFYNANSGVEMDSGSTTIIGCHFYDCNNGISISDDASTIQDCLIENCNENGIDVDDSEIEDNEPAENPIINITNCVILNNGQSEGHRGMTFEHGTITVKNTIVAGSSGANLFFESPTERSTVANFDHCDFYNSLIGLGIGTAEPARGIVTFNLTNSNVVDVDGIMNGADALGQMKIDYCNIFTTGQQFLGFTEFIETSNILNVDPEYVDPANGDFTLKPTSPVLTAGEGGTFIGAKGIPTVMKQWMIHN